MKRSNEERKRQHKVSSAIKKILIFESHAQLSLVVLRPAAAHHMMGFLKHSKKEVKRDVNSRLKFVILPRIDIVIKNHL